MSEPTTPNPAGFGYDHNELKKARPDLRKRHFFCVKCRKEPYKMESTALHVAGRVGVLSGEGAIIGVLECHGERMSVGITFSDAQGYMSRGELIPVFDNVNPLDPRRIVSGEDGGRLLT
jgi:hypothetical protein